MCTTAKLTPSSTSIHPQHGVRIKAMARHDPHHLQSHPPKPPPQQHGTKRPALCGSLWPPAAAKYTLADSPQPGAQNLRRNRSQSIRHVEQQPCGDYQSQMPCTQESGVCALVDTASSTGYEVRGFLHQPCRYSPAGATESCGTTQAGLEHRAPGAPAPNAQKHAPAAHRMAQA